MMRKFLPLLLILGLAAPAYAAVLTPQPQTVSATSTATTVSFNPAVNRVDVANSGTGTVYALGGIAIRACETVYATFSDPIASTSVYTIGSDTATVYVTGYKLSGAQADNVVRTGSSSGCASTFSSSSASFGAANFLSTMSGASATSNFLNVTGTLPTTPTAQARGIYFGITGAGSASQIQTSLAVDMLGGYTGASSTFGINVFSGATGTASGYLSAGTGNFAMLGLINSATAGANIGISGVAVNGGAGKAIGVLGRGAVGVMGNGGATGTGGWFGTVSAEPTLINTPLNINNGSAAVPIFVAQDNSAALPTTGATATFAILDGATVQVGNGVLTSGTMTAETQANVRHVYSSYTWTNAMVAALSGGADDITVATLPAKTVVYNAYVVILTPDTSANALTVACGRTSTTYIDYIVASDAKAAANTVYGDASGERGTNLVGYDLPSYTTTTAVKCHFIKTSTNLSTVTGSTGRVILETALLP